MDSRHRTKIIVFLTAWALLLALVTALPVSDNLKFVLLSTHLVLYFTFVYDEMAAFRVHFGQTADWLRTYRALGRAARKHELYPSMTSAVSAMRDHAYVVYASQKGPAETGNAAEVQYHERLRDAIRNQQAQVFKRIIVLLQTDTDAKRAWIKEELNLQEQYADSYSIRFLIVEDERAIPYLVQIFDNFVFLIDPARSNDEALPRDVHVVDEGIAGIFQRYYIRYFDSLPTETPLVLRRGSDSPAGPLPPPE